MSKKGPNLNFTCQRCELMRASAFLLWNFILKGESMFSLQTGYAVNYSRLVQVTRPLYVFYK